MKKTNILKIVTAISFVGLASWVAFARLFFAQHLTESQTGLLLSIPGFVLIISQPAWGFLSDYTGSIRSNYQIMLVGAGSILLVFYLWSEFFLGNFLLLLLLIGIYSLFYTARSPVRNSLTLSYIEGEEEGFGRIRLWSSVGFAASAVFLGYFFTSAPLELLFPLISIPYFLAALIAFSLPQPKKQTLDSMNIFTNEEIHKALKNKRLWVFLTFIFIFEVGRSGPSVFLPLYLREVIGLSILGLGIFYAFQAVVELPWFYYGDKILERIGVRPFVLIGFSLFSVIWLAIGLYKTPLVAFTMWGIRGLGFTFVRIGSIYYIDNEVTEKTRTIGQSLYMTISLGIAAIIGRTVGGVFADTYGISNLYIMGGLLGISATVGLIIFWET